MNKFFKNPENIKNYKKKLYLNEFSEKLLEAPDSFVDWFIS